MFERNDKIVVPAPRFVTIKADDGREQEAIRRAVMFQLEREAAIRADEEDIELLLLAA